MLRVLVVAAAGGLGSSLVREALHRGHTVQVLVRSEAKLQAALGTETLARLAAVHVGDATADQSVAKRAIEGIDVVLSAAPPDAVLARTLALESPKLVWVAGASNLLEADGRSHHLSFGPSGEGFYNAHAPVIDSIKAAGKDNFVIFCPGVMRPGTRSTPPPVPFSTADPESAKLMDFISYEDAASVMVTAAETGTYDGQLIGALSPPAAPSKEQEL